ncbi:MAG: hypothetical protein GWM92_11380 [Gemmatimonadetes bacterium]|nr:hypothetical protein [Gemmatimonadota bacterium]NIR79298.1 hypothetical protein [Gemmatimonadota bacterium]NIT87955.1 hypothetical protein [Gemmatimonadota bacterium]NIU31806.1 hypothetical protein [Gemmatimonadota bacterium]NIU36421.1 hypothetical protein [Gemmatimonadota bacterium]
MSPAPGSRPISPRLLNQLATALRAVEGARRSDEDREEAVGTALEDLGVLAELVRDLGEGSLPEGVPARIEEAREALEGDQVEDAREILLGVGRAIDDFLRS